MSRRAHERTFRSSDVDDFDIHKENFFGLGHRIPGMESIIATTTGYRGQEKTKLIDLIIKTGAIYTGSLTKCTTHLICWEFQGPRYALAKKLSVIILNHKWLEDCLQAGGRIPESGYIMHCGREVGPLSWTSQMDAEVTRHKSTPLSDNQVTVVPNSSAPIVPRESPLQMKENFSKSHILSDNCFNQEAAITNSKRPTLIRRDKQVEQRMPLQDIINTHVINNLHSEKAEFKLAPCSTSKQNMEKQKKKTRRLVKKSEHGSILNYLTHLEDDIGQPTDMNNPGEDKDSGRLPKPGQEAFPSEAGIEFIRCTSAENRKISNEEQPPESTADMEIDLEKDVGTSLPSGLPDPNPSNDVACVICLTDSSSSRGVLSCGHRFCFKCIHKWAAETASKKKEPTCPLCLKSFEFITVKNHATSSDQKIFSQSLPEFMDDIFMVHGQDDVAANLQFTMNLQCNICRSADTEELLLKCHRCGRRAAHTFCLDPPLPPVPDVPWICTPCTSGRRPVYEFS